MKEVILVSSETGYTRKYADWISEKTGIEIIETNLRSNVIPSNYQIIVFGSPIYGGELLGKKRLKQLIKETKDTKIICFATGLMPTGEEAKRMLQRQFKEEELIRLLFFYLPGGLDRSKLKPSRRTERFLYRMMIKRHPNSSTGQKELGLRLERDCDYTEEALLQPLLEELNVQRAIIDT